MNLLSLADWSRAQIEEALQVAAYVKRRPREYARELEGRVLLMIFEKPSLRTRVSFEAAMLQLGGHAIHYDLGMSPWAMGKETAGDTARTASRYVDAIMARLFRKAELDALAAGATVPVINGLTDFEHPCQAVGDLMTMRERFGPHGRLKLAYVGDGLNNVTHSLLDGCAKLGIDIAVGCPADAGYEPAAAVLDRARRFASESGSAVEVVRDAVAAVRGAHVVTTDTWMSYHIPASSREERMKALEPFRVTTALMASARPEAVFLHCLPAQRGMEVAADVIDGPRSLVFDQAENRLHTEKAILLELMK